MPSLAFVAVNQFVAEARCSLLHDKMKIVVDSSPTSGFERQYGASPDDDNFRIITKTQAKSFCKDNIYQRHTAGYTKALYGM